MQSQLLALRRGLSMFLLGLTLGVAACANDEPAAGLRDVGTDGGSVTDAGQAMDAAGRDAGSAADATDGDAGLGDTAVRDGQISDGAADAGTPADASSPSDAGSGDSGSSDSGSGDAGSNSRCTHTASNIRCSHRTEIIRIGTTVLSDRDVHYQVPRSPPPADGYPVVLVFQGSFNSASLIWDSNRNAPFGRYHMSATVKELLDRGYAVITPEAHFGGTTYWDTNVPPYAVFWETSNDHRLMLAILDGISAGDFGTLDSARMYATGISSGGYMTSRMAVSYPGRFTALAIHSGSYATCGGVLCVVPSSLPGDHPPTLFAHGAADLVVPISTMRSYADRLTASGVTIDTVVNQSAGHEWLEDAVLSIPNWFDSYP